MKLKLIATFIFLISSAVNYYISAQEIEDNSNSKPQVMVLGTFHFAYPNLDIIKTEEKDKIDFTKPEKQKEIENLVAAISKYNPTKIAVELKTWAQTKTDSLYNEYLAGNYTLPVNESYSIGFRLAKLLGHKKIYCVDVWGNIGEYFDGDNKNIFNIKDEKKEMMKALEAYSDSLLQNKKIYKNRKNISNKLLDILIEINQPENNKLDHAGYLNNLFLFEHHQGDYTGVDWITASWFNRNLRIFRNIQRITDSPYDRILIIYGSGHTYLLNQFLEGSFSYNVIPVLNYLIAE